MSTTTRSIEALAGFSLAAALVMTGASQGGSGRHTLDRSFVPETRYSVERREAQQRRQELRDSLEWASLGDQFKANLWDQAVGPDQIDAEGNLLVEFLWSSTTGQFFPQDIDLNVEGDLILAGGETEFSSSGNPKVRRLDGTKNTGGGLSKWTDTWEEITGNAVASAVDLDGNAYVLVNGGSGERFLVKYRDNGARIWEKQFPLQDFPKDVEVDPEGTVYVCGGVAGGLSEQPFVERIDPVQGQTYWRVDYTDFGVAEDVATDRNGRVYVARWQNDEEMDFDVGADLAIARLDAFTGEIIWEHSAPTPTTDKPSALEIDFEGCPIVTGGGFVEGGGGTVFSYTIKVSPSGIPQWANVDDGDSRDLAIDAVGNTYVVGSAESFNAGFKILKYTPDGALEWELKGTQDNELIAVALDRLGNPYAIGVNGGKLRTKKYNKEDTDRDGFGEEVWTATEDLNSPTARGIIVDAGGNVYSIATADDDGVTIKYAQPFESVPQVAVDNPVLQIENTSIWHPSLPTLEYQEVFFNQSWDIDPNLSTGFNIDGVGEFGGDVELDTDGSASIGFRAFATLGSADATYPGEVTIIAPGSEELFAGFNFPIFFNWEPDEGAAALIANGVPQLNAGLTGKLDAKLKAGVEVVAADSEVIDITLVNGNIDAGANDQFIPDLNLGDMLGIAQPGDWFDYGDDDNFVTASIKYPELAPEGGLSNDGFSLKSSVEELFITMRANVTNIMSTTLFSTPTIISKDFEDGNSVATVSGAAELRALQAFVRGDFFATQDLEIEMRPYVDLELSDGLQSRRVYLDTGECELLSGGEPNGEPCPCEGLGGDPCAGNPLSLLCVCLTLPDDGNLHIDPTYGVEATFFNDTGFIATGTVGWETMNFECGVGADVKIVGDVDIFGFDNCYGPCPEKEIAAIADPDVYSDSWSLDFPEVKLARLRLVGDTDTLPELSGASRGSVRAILYDQTSPSVGEFNVQVNDTARTVLYGTKLFDSDIDVRISHYGTVESIPVTHINDNTLLVEIPKRYFLFPGVARLWVNTSEGSSNTVDIPIEYPRPNLETVNPNLWAADPELATIPVAVIDGLTPAGFDSFIARRDYWIVLRDQLWNNTTADGLSATQAFPDFDFNQKPAFPAVRFDGVALARFEQPIDNGIHNVRLPVSLYDEPNVIDVVLCNPGPGGGASPVKQLNIAAPIPVVQGLDPEMITPGSGDFELFVYGPANVPTFSGYEEPKFGNFTAASEVIVDGQAVQTQFVNSSQLIAKVPGTLVADAGQLTVSVFTPDNGSVYFEELWIDGESEPFFQGLVASGGTSNGLVLEVGWDDPVITGTTVDEVEVGSAAFDGVPEYNLSLIGENFAPGCIVLIDGEERETLREGDNLVRVKLLPVDVSYVRTAEVVVLNPSPDLAVSDPMMFQVVPKEEE